MKFVAEVDVMPRKELLDPQGKTVANSMGNLHLTEITDVRVGKHITLTIEAADKATAEEKVELACKKLLANPVMESYHFTLSEA